MSRTEGATLVERAERIIERLPRCSLLVLVAFTLLFAAAPAHAESREKEAALAFDSASKAYARGEYRRAASRFERAFRLVPHPDAAYNAGLAWDKAGQPARAAEAFEAAIGRDLREDAHEDASSRLSELRQRLGFLSITARPGSTVRVDGRAKKAPAEFYVEPGEHRITVIVAGGPKRTRAVEVVAGGEVAVAFDDGGGVATDDTVAPEGDERSSVLPAIGWTAVAVGAVLTGAAIYVGTRSVAARDEFNASDRTDADLRDRALGLQTWTRAAWVGAAVVGATGITILVLDATRSNESTVDARVGPTGAAVRARF